MKTKLSSKFLFFAAALALAISIFAKPVDVNAAAAAPINLRQTDATADSVTIKWDKPATLNAGYNVQFSTDKQNWKDVGYSIGNGKVFFDGHAEIYTLAQGTTYYVRVCVKETQTTLGEYSTILAVDTAPASLGSLQQTGISEQTATITWPSSAGATGYEIYYGTSENIEAASHYQDVTTTSINMNLGKNSGYYIFVFPYRNTANSTFKAVNSGLKIIAVTTPSKPNSLTIYKANYKNNSSTLMWIPTSLNVNTDGYEYEVYQINTKGKAKRIKKGTTNTYDASLGLPYVNINSAKLFNSTTSFRVRSYVVINGKKYYSDWTKEKRNVPQAVQKKLKAVSKSSAKLTWKKITGAESYTIYYKTDSNPNAKWKVIAKKVKGTSATVKYNRYGRSYYYVKANKVKAGKKKLNTPSVNKAIYWQYWTFR